MILVVRNLRYNLPTWHWYHTPGDTGIVLCSHFEYGGATLGVYDSPMTSPTDGFTGSIVAMTDVWSEAVRLKDIHARLDKKVGV